jgi:regulator of sigma E protease
VSFLVAVLGLAFLILIHEAGHFFTALAVGMKPRSFNLGFGPPLAKVRRKDIDYAVRSIPLGGYVKIPGMHRPVPEDVDAYFGRVLREAPQLVGPAERTKRALGAGDLDQARQELDALGAAARRTGVGTAERGLQELGDALSEEAYWRQRTWKRVAVIVAGPATNVLLAMVLFTVILAGMGGFYRLGFVLSAQGEQVTRVVDSVLSDEPAQRMGLKPGDAIIAVNDKPVTPAEISKEIRASAGEPVGLTVRRAGEQLTLGPVRAQREGDYTFPGAAWQSLKLTGIISRETVKRLGSLVHKQAREEISSTVGIVQRSSDAAQEGWADYLFLLGFISLSLALLNLLPLLPLDGGHIAVALVEAIRGRSVSRAVYERFSAVGIALVLLLFFVGLSNDVGRLGGG